MSAITINGNIDSRGPDQDPGIVAENASDSNYILVQTSAPLSEEEKTQLRNLKVIIQQYVSTNTYLCGYKPTDLDQIRSLPFVTHANVYLKQFKVSASLKQINASPSLLSLPLQDVESESTDLHTVDIVFHTDVDPSTPELKSAVASAAHVS